MDKQRELLRGTLAMLLLETISLGLAWVGIFGVLSMFVNQRT